MYRIGTVHSVDDTNSKQLRKNLSQIAFIWAQALSYCWEGRMTRDTIAVRHHPAQWSHITAKMSVTDWLQILRLSRSIMFSSDAIQNTASINRHKMKWKWDSERSLSVATVNRGTNCFYVEIKTNEVAALCSGPLGTRLEYKVTALASSMVHAIGMFSMVW